MKKTLKKIALVGLTLLASYLPLSCTSFNQASKKSPAYEYALSKGLEGTIAEPIGKKLDYLDGNDREFIDIISSYSSELQKACVNSDILDNGHVSKKELENTKEATLEGIVNPEEIYAVLANGYNVLANGHNDGGWGITSAVFFYEMFKDNHVDDENIALLMHNTRHEDYTDTDIQKDLRSDPEGFIKDSYNPQYPSKEDQDIIKQTLKEYTSLTKDEIEIDSEEVNRKKFLDAIKNLKSDYNDTAYIFYNSHGMYRKEKGFGFVGIGEKSITSPDLNKAIRDMEYEKLIVIGASCRSAGFLKNLNKPKKIRNTLAIASAGEEEDAPIDWPIRFVINYEKYKNISDIVNRSIDPNYSIIPFYFDTEKEECPWLDEPFIEPQK